jgi:hypothetical protein
MDIYSLAYKVEFDGPRGPERVTVPAFRVLQWTKVPDAVAGNYFARMYPNVKLIGDNSKNFGTPKWNANEYEEYPNPVRPEDARLIVDYDEKKNWYFTGAPRPAEEPQRPSQTKTIFKARNQRQEDAADNKKEN